MARKWSNLNLRGALHYVTGNVVNRINIFNQDHCAVAFLKTLKELLEKWPCKLITYVVMPDHFHLIVNPIDGDIQQFCGALKSLTARELITITGGEMFLRSEPDVDGSIHQVWQESFKAIALWSQWMIWQKINYIHSNPVKARLVKSARDYPWTGFRDFFSETKEPLEVDHDWWWADDVEKLHAEMKRRGWQSYHRRISPSDKGRRR
jgi:REP element-mobilizing transposase RayT